MLSKTSFIRLKRQIKADFELEGEGDSAVYHFYVPDCASCVQDNCLIGKQEELRLDHPNSWACFGLGLPPDNPLNEHDEYNRVRFCFLDYTGHVTTHHFTYAEAFEVAVKILSLAGAPLVDWQPGLSLKEVHERLVEQINLNREGEKDE